MDYFKLNNNEGKDKIVETLYKVLMFLSKISAYLIDKASRATDL
jgi:hypothetical protein